MNETEFTSTQLLLKQSGLTVRAAQYHPESFGSWFVEIVATPSMRVVWDGKDGWLIVQEEASAVSSGSPAWRDIWIGKARSEQTAERAVEVIRTHVGAG